MLRRNWTNEPIGTWIVKRYDWVLGRTVEPGGGLDGLREGITLFGFILTVVVALILYTQNVPEPSAKVIAIYFMALVAPLVGIFSICAMRTNGDGTSKPSFKQEHRRIMWRLGILSVAIMLSSSFAYWTELLPGQGVAKLANLEPATFSKADEHLWRAQFRTTVNATEPDKEPAPWHVLAYLTGRTRKQWRIKTLNSYFDQERQRKDSTFGKDADDPVAVDDSWAGTINKAKSATYWIDVIIAKRDCVEGDDHEQPSKDDVHIKISTP